MKSYLASIALIAITLTSLSANAGDSIVGQKRTMEADPSLTLVILQAKDDLKIEGISVNRNAKCDLKAPESDEQRKQRMMMGDPFPRWQQIKYPLNVSFGGKFGGVTSCNPLEIVVKTNKGDKTLEWDN